MRPRLVLWLIIILTLLAAWINTPSASVLPDKVNLLGREISLVILKDNQLELTPFGRKLDLGFLTLSNITGHFPVRLGLDLQGGSQLTLETRMDAITPEDRDTALESAREVIERRVNLYGVSESVVQTSRLGDQRRILVELPGVKDASAAANLVGTTAQLDFREFPPGIEEEASKSGTPVFLLAKETGLTGADLKKATVTFGSGGKDSGPQIAIEFTDEGAKKFGDITKMNVGRPLGIYLDSVPVMWPPPTVQQEILGGNAVITGQFTPQEAKDLAIQLNAGALPVPIEILEQRSIGATLGEESVQRSWIAGVIGLVTVMIFMVAYYGIYGLIADLALIIYTLLVLAIFRTGLFIIPPVTLTLAGIAGFILSIGMAVDANILTFERIKEELQAGKRGRIALEIGFSRAWTSIRDSNMSSSITAIILIILGTSVVRGFAVTLLIGVLVSMFSAITVTRTFLRLMPRFKK
ncbi:MAG: protein translocase subunit SecD [Armatimonadetes bacterium]|nr:MAG: protein translocase subunit SecD [Armatimonadota bacterium]